MDHTGLPLFNYPTAPHNGTDTSLAAAREEAQKRYRASLEPVKRGPGRPKKNPSNS